MKTFTIVSADKNSRQSFNTEASTVGQLLEELRNRNINYVGMTLYEGLTKSTFEVTDVDGILPHDVPYTNKKTGETIVTSNLVFMLSTTKKKTSSGAMTRKELLNAIKNANLCDEVLKTYGRNYTQVPSADLNSILEDFYRKEADKVNSAKAVEEPANEENPCEEGLCPAQALILGFIHAALEQHIIPSEEIVSMLVDLNVLQVNEEADKEFNDEEIDSILSGH